MRPDLDISWLRDTEGRRLMVRIVSTGQTFPVDGFRLWTTAYRDPERMKIHGSRMCVVTGGTLRFMAFDGFEFFMGSCDDES